jgi:hypothetical protein
VKNPISLSLSLSLSGEHLLVAPLHPKYREHAEEQAGQLMTHHGSRKTFDEQWQSEIETISPNYHRLRTRTAMSNESCCLVVLGRQQSARERERERATRMTSVLKSKNSSMQSIEEGDSCKCSDSETVSHCFSKGTNTRYKKQYPTRQEQRECV